MNENDYSVESLIASESFQAFSLKSSSEEIQKWETWLAANPGKKSDAEEARKWILAMHAQTSPNEAKLEWEKLSKKLTVKGKTRPMFPLWLRTAAATILLLLGIGFLWNAQRPSYTKYATAYGEIKLVDLPDGSKLTMNGHSKVRFTEGWEESDAREIWLEGEAYFDVRYDSVSPLIVHMKHGDIKVLGSKFNALHRGDVQRVTLIEGSLEVNNSRRKGIELQPGEQIVINEGKWESDQIDLEPVTAWKDHKMIFRDASIESIINKLKWDFNWEIQVKDSSIMRRRVNAFIHENNPELLLEALAEIYDLEFVKLDEGKFIIQ